MQMMTRERVLAIPVQERSLGRITRVIEAAERMLEELGPEKTSIPALAQISEVPRASIYPFFPDKYAPIRAHCPDPYAAPRRRYRKFRSGTDAHATYVGAYRDRCLCGLLQRSSSSERASSERLF